MLTIPATRRLRQEDHELKASLGCIMRNCQKKKKKKKPKTHSVRYQS
jgi:hypothetical protein